MFKFPRDFLWGAATSAHQVEGDNHNDWSEWEKENAERLSRASGGKYPTENYISGRACDHYNRFRKDFDIAKSLGHNAHRFSIEWSRIEPEEGKFDRKEIEHYREVIKALRERGIEPFVTLWHWTNPIWIRDIGGWENPKTVDYFLRYVQKVLPILDGVTFVMLMNELGTYIGMSYVQGTFTPNVKSIRRANQVFKNILSAQRQSYDVIHAVSPHILVGLSHYAVHMSPYKNLPWNWVLVKILDYIRNWRFPNHAKGKFDFIGLQYYHTDFIKLVLGKGRWGPITSQNPTTWLNDRGWLVYPEGIYHLLKKASRYGKPIYITENGIADAKDVHREKFIKEHLEWISKAIGDGVDVRGYFHWSLLDNFEWETGFWPRFGLVEVDYKTMERKIRPSAWKYKEIIEKSL